MYTVGRLIHQLNNYDKELTLELLLEEEEFASVLQGIYTSLPEQSKSTAQRIFRTTGGITKKKKTRSAALTTVLEIHVIALPPDIQSLFQVWKANPSEFWMAYGAQLGAQWNSGESIEKVATAAYLVVRHLNLRRLLDTILWRFYANFFYNLALLLGNGQVNMSDGLYQRLLNALLQSGEITDEIVVIVANLRNWMAAGSRYHKICLRLDKGALFLLPQVSDNVWEDEHSLKGSDFDMAIAHLKRQGIMKLSDQLGADDLSTRILNHALEPFRWDITLAAPTLCTSYVDGCEPRIEVESGAPIINPNSIGALLNAAEHIAATTEGQESPSVRSSSLPDRINLLSSESLVREENHPLAGEEVHATVRGQSETCGSRSESRDSDSQAEALNLRRKRRRIDSYPNPNLALTQPPIRSMYKQGGAYEETNLSGAKGHVASGMKIAIMAEMEKLAGILGGYLFKGINTSHMRHQEKERLCIRFTDTVRLHLAYREGEDIKLEIWLCASIGNNITQETICSAEGLRNILGDYLFEAMETSNWRKEERKGRCNFGGAVNISPSNEHNSSDCKLEVLLGSKMGLDFYQIAFP